MSEIELHRKLLGDRVRNQALHAALAKVLRPGASVADLGAGTGFLSFLARRLGASHCHLYEYSEALGLARELARANGITGLTFVQAHSTEVARPPKVDVVVSETLGNYALEEGMLETLADAHRFLKPGGTLLPRGLRQFVAPVADAGIQRGIDVFGEVDPDLDFSAAREVALNNMYVRSIAPAQLAGRDAGREWDAIDFTAKARPSSQRSGTASWPRGTLGGAAVHGFALWWEAELAPGIVLSTSPLAPATHWEQVYLPLREPIEAGTGDLELSLQSDTRRGVRLVWEATLRCADGKPRSRQRLDLLKGRL